MRVATRTFRCARFCRWRITSVLCWPPGMRILKAAAAETSIPHLRGRADSSMVPPRLWPRLPLETRRQLAQHVGQLVRRLRPQSTPPEEGHRAEHDVVDG
jgi:hypothetical protein